VLSGLGDEDLDEFHTLRDKEVITVASSGVRDLGRSKLVGPLPGDRGKATMKKSMNLATLGRESKSRRR
jgi:hypothetical protein